MRRPRRPARFSTPPAGIYRNRPATGVARVVCYSPRHNLTLAELETAEIVNLMRVWQEQYVELGAREEINHVLIFENKGEVVGVSNPHPHCQIYATNFVFKTIETEARVSERHLAETGRVLFQDILKAEREDGRRIIFENESAIVFLPYFARYAYEAFVAPKASHPSIATLSEAEVARFRRGAQTSSGEVRQPVAEAVPVRDAAAPGADRRGRPSRVPFPHRVSSAAAPPNLMKYLAGPEIGGGNFLSDTSPEEKAAELRAQPEIHYKQLR